MWFFSLKQLHFYNCSFYDSAQFTNILFMVIAFLLMKSTELSHWLSSNRRQIFFVFVCLIEFWFVYSCVKKKWKKPINQTFVKISTFVVYRGNKRVTVWKPLQVRSHLRYFGLFWLIPEIHRLFICHFDFCFLFGFQTSKLRWNENCLKRNMSKCSLELLKWLIQLTC